MPRSVNLDASRLRFLWARYPVKALTLPGCVKRCRLLGVGYRVQGVILSL